MSSNEVIPDDVPEEEKVRELKAIAIMLHVDLKTVKRFAERAENPLPIIHDHTGYWMEKSKLQAWIDGERKSYTEHVKHVKARRQARPAPARLAS